MECKIRWPAQRNSEFIFLVRGLGGRDLTLRSATYRYCGTSSRVGTSRNSGGSVWESNPPFWPRRTESMALKATRVTGPHSPPNCVRDGTATPLRIIADRAQRVAPVQRRTKCTIESAGETPAVRLNQRERQIPSRDTIRDANTTHHRSPQTDGRVRDDTDYESAGRRETFLRARSRSFASVQTS